jgi:hypothetical protein
MYRVISRPAPCLGRLAFVWTLYGWGVATLWGMAGGRPLADSVVWAAALLAGIALAMREL